jgi:ribosomal protein S12 methylthiotransferase
MSNLYLHNLGCSKNQIDGEMLSGLASRRGIKITDHPEDAEIIVVNTCAFIKEAQEEAIEAILSAANYKKTGRCQKLYVCGCFPEKYSAELAQELPEVDGFFGVLQWQALLEKLVPTGQPLQPNPYLDRLRGTPSHYAYLRIADGCDHGCAFCAIPAIRGKYRSRPIDDIIAEVEMLAANGVKELIPVAQELNSYGHDLGLGNKNRPLMDLLRKIAKVQGIEWIRPLYLHPPVCDFELIDFWASQPKLCRYLDLPIEHASNRMIKAMGRGGSQKQIRQLIEYARHMMPDVIIRTSIIVGFPGETREDFKTLLDFVKEIKFDRLGGFRYSAESGTFAQSLPVQVSERTKLRRLGKLMDVQRDIALELNEKRVGSILEVYVDDYEDSSGYSIAHSRWELPELDGEILLDGKYPIGQKLEVRVESVLEYDLIAKPV